MSDGCKCFITHFLFCALEQESSIGKAPTTAYLVWGNHHVLAAMITNVTRKRIKITIKDSVDSKEPAYPSISLLSY